MCLCIIRRESNHHGSLSGAVWKWPLGFLLRSLNTEGWLVSTFPANLSQQFCKHPFSSRWDQSLAQAAWISERQASFINMQVHACMRRMHWINVIHKVYVMLGQKYIPDAYLLHMAGWVARIVLTFTSSSSDKISSLRDAKVCFSSWSTVSLLGFSRSISFCRRVKLRAVEMSSLPTSGNSTGGYRDKTGFDLGRPLFGGVIGTSDAGLFRMFAERTLCTRSINFFSQEPCDKSAW